MFGGRAAQVRMEASAAAAETNDIRHLAAILVRFDELLIIRKLLHGVQCWAKL